MLLSAFPKCKILDGKGCLMANALTCFARGRPGEWEAICLDYDIAVQGRTFNEVEELLHDAIDDYVETARREPQEVRDRLLRRAAPLHVRWGYILGFVWHNVNHRRSRQDADKLEHSFQMSCPA
jgi:hypothetical protein